MPAYGATKTIRGRFCVWDGSYWRFESPPPESRPYSTEITPIGEQFVIPGAERQTTKKHPQGELF